MIRRIRLLLVAAVFGVALVFAGTTTASACDPGTPASPKDGFAGSLSAPPANPPTDPQAPFKDPSIPIADVYGYNWSLGCNTGLMPNLVDHTANKYAGKVFDATGADLALLGALETLAHDSGMGWATDMITKVAEGIRPIIFGGTTNTGVIVSTSLMSLVFGASGLWIILKASKMTASDVANTAFVALFALALASMAIFSPTVLSKGVDQIATQTAQLASTPFSTSLTDGAHRQAQYRAWLGSQFGDPDSQAAKDWGPQLKEATTYTWAEWAQIQANPEAAEGIDDEKKELFDEVLDDVEANHPHAAEYLKGDQARSGWAQSAIFFNILMGIFALLSYLIVIMARVLLQVLVIVAPFAALAGILPKGGVAMMRLAGQAGAYVWAIFKFTLAAGVMGLFLGGLSLIHPILGPIWMGIATILGLIFLKPFSAFKNLSPNLPVNKSFFGKLFGLLKQIIALLSGAGAAGAVAGMVGGKTAEAATAKRQESGATSDMVRAQLNVPQPPPLERVRFEPIPGTQQHRPLPPPPPPASPGLPGGGPGPQPLAPGGAGLAETRGVVIEGPGVPVTVHHRHEGRSEVVISGEVLSVEDKIFRPATTRQAEVVNDEVVAIREVPAARPVSDRPQRELQLFVPPAK